MKNQLLLASAFVLISSISMAQKDKKKMIADLDAKKDHYTSIAKSLWENPELGYLEEKSSALASNQIKKKDLMLAGVQVRRNERK